MTKNNSKILILSDLHIPFEHKDAMAFLRAVKLKYKPNKVVCIGDEVDNHGISFHDSDPDLMSPGDELKIAQRKCRQLYKLFPKMDLVDSNHGSLAYRRSKAGGIPIHFFKGYNEILDVGQGWQWHNELILRSGGRDIIFRHQFSATILKSAEQMGMSCVQGHYHSKFEIAYTSSPLALNWGMTVGCLIHTSSLAFEYNKLQLKRPILGVGFITNGVPHLIPMVLTKSGRWNKVVD